MRDSKYNTENLSSTPAPLRAQACLDLHGKFVVVSYHELPLMGQPLTVVGEDIQVSTMRQSGDSNLFMLPQTLIVFDYIKKDAVLSVPEPASPHYSELGCQS